MIRALCAALLMSVVLSVGSASAYDDDSPYRCGPGDRSNSCIGDRREERLREVWEQRREIVDPGNLRPDLVYPGSPVDGVNLDNAEAAKGPQGVQCPPERTGPCPE